VCDWNEIVMDLRWISDLEVREDGVVVHEAVQQVVCEEGNEDSDGRSRCCW